MSDADTTLTWLGHSTALLEVGGVRLLTDPLLRRRAGPLRRRGPVPDPRGWARIDAVLMSHLHLDHAHVGSMRMLDPGVPVLSAARNVAWLRRHRLNGTVARLDEWQSVGGAEAVQVRLTTAVHHSRPMPHRPNEANGFLVRAPGCRTWIAGDTSLHDDMSRIPALLGGEVDLALVPISGWGPRLSEGHLDATGAAEACRRVRARTAVPVHWGTFYFPGVRDRPQGWMDRPPPEFVATLAQVAPDCRPLVLRPGESAVVPVA